MPERRPHLSPRNLTAQLGYRGAGNPPVTTPASAISNSYPGLECDLRNAWKRIFVGIELHEADNVVVAVEDPQYERLLGRRILRVACGTDGEQKGDSLVVEAKGPERPGASGERLVSRDYPNAALALEWSNATARLLHEYAGKTVLCEFTRDKAPVGVLPPELPGDGTEMVALEVRVFYEPGTVVLARDRVKPGELTQSLCSPWQNDYRECACYYWAASRPDYVNVEPTEDGVSRGQNWMQKERGPENTQEYILDDRSDSRLVSYEDLFENWERLLFEIRGRDVE